jgi:hypothetical protein
MSYWAFPVLGIFFIITQKKAKPSIVHFRESSGKRNFIFLFSCKYTYEAGIDRNEYRRNKLKICIPRNSCPNK